jgi:arsenate reductase
MWTLYGLKTCDSCRKASAWLKQHNRPFSFHDLRDDGVDTARIATWAERLGWDKLLNRSSTTWRSLTEAERADLDRERAIDLLNRYPTLNKRPVLEAGDALLLGFKPEHYAKLP